jgi:predicted NBD/HSP70 family sugar kinase
VLLSLNSSARFVVGVKVMPGSLVAVVTDLDAEVIAHRELERLGTPVHQDGSLGTTPTEVVESVAQLVDDVIKDAEIERSDILGVGLGLAGFIDGNAGVCRYSPFFGWRDVNLASPLTLAMGLDVYIENDVNSLTIAENWFGHGRGYEHFVVVTVGRGIGVGYVLNGRFYAGHEGGVGELGHITVVPNGPACRCGRQGCLEVMASDRALIQAARDSIVDGRLAALTDSDDITIEELVTVAIAGDDTARSLIAESGRWLGICLATIVNLLNPELIIVAGEGVEAGDLRLDPMREALREGRFDSLGTDTKLVVESSGDVTWARGAACVVLSEFFRSPLHRGRPAPVALSKTG